MNLIALVPGVIPQGAPQGSATGNQTAAGDFTNAFGWGNYQIGGGIAGQSLILYDGATLNSSYGNTSNIVLTQQNPLVLVASPQYPSDHDLESHDHLFAPRIGLSYRSSNDTVWRAGYGINFLPQWATSAAPYSSPINAATTNVPFGGTLSDPLLNQPLLQPTGRTPGGLAQFQGQSIASRIRNQKYPYVQQWNFDIQQALGPQAWLELAYAGSRGEHLPLPKIDINQLPDSDFSLGLALLVPNQAGVPAGQLLRPYPEYQQVIATGSFAGDSDYDSLLVKFQRRFPSEEHCWPTIHGLSSSPIQRPIPTFSRRTP
jgi:hypothetical protein